MTELNKLYDAYGNPVQLGRKLGIGGEGKVYEVPSKGNDIVAKIYHDPLKREKEEKILAMTSAYNDKLGEIAAWPLGTLHLSKGGPVRGLLMPRVTGYKEIHILYGPSHRKQEFPQADWAFLIHVARNLASALDTIHRRGNVVGDINPGNIVAASSGYVKFIDCDSFQITTSGKRFPCEVGVAHFTPPELQNRSFVDIIRTQNHDNFGLALICFHLLFMGRHPFAGRYTGGKEDMPIERAILEFRFAYGSNSKAKKMQPPPHTLPLHAASPTIASFFEKAFGEHGVHSSRPTARQWIKALEKLQQSLRVCSKEPAHKFYNSFSECPWCSLENHAGIYFFVPVMIKGIISSFDLSEAWKRIKSITPPINEAIPSFTFNKIKPKPMPDRIRESRRLLTFWKFIGTGIGISLLIVAESGWFLIVIGLLLLPVVIEFLWQFYSPNSEKSEIHKRQDTLHHAQRQWESAKNRWYHETNTERFYLKYQNLERIRKGYENLSNNFQKDKQHLEKNVRESQLNNFLKKFFIDTASIPGIGPTRKATLSSYGIETAADVSSSAIQRIPGFGPFLSKKLLDWRSEKEKNFIFNPSKGVNPADLTALQQRYKARKSALESMLLAGHEELIKIKDEISTKRKSLYAEMEKIALQVEQAEVDLTLIEK
jgi:DNA-binding helix-hairpin-helix protein with protein kinase domain